MIINNTSIKGFYNYSPTSKYESGDFVVLGDVIYVCSPKNGIGYVFNEDPSTSENFYIYLGEGSQMSTISDFINFVKQKGGLDKYISISSLVGILNSFCKGINTSGIIGEEITLAGQDLNVTVDEINGDYDKESILSCIMEDPLINNAVFKVSRNLPEIITYVGSSKASLNYSYCILKQYTYNGDNNLIVRVQELIDHELGNIFYRTGTISSSGKLENITSFTIAVIQPESLKSRAENLFDLYKTKLLTLDQKLNELMGNFCFTKIELPSSGISELFLHNNPEKKDKGIYIISVDTIGPITLDILTDLGGEVYESNSVSIDPSLGSFKYHINNSLFIEVIKETPEATTTTTSSTLSPTTTTTTTPLPGNDSSIIEITIKPSDTETTKIFSAYYRKYFRR